MAQDFQDLTGHVIMWLRCVVWAMEAELVQVLVDNVPQELREETKSLRNGPAVNPQGKVDVVTSQDQVDDLLSSLGFRSEEHTSELQSLMRISYAVFCLKKKQTPIPLSTNNHTHSQSTEYYLHRCRRHHQARNHSLHRMIRSIHITS